jgi:drug/metabolite transporter (DMT)-like permease
VLIVVAAMACFAGLDTLAKYTSAFVPVVVIAWFRFLTQAVVVGAVLLPNRGWAIFRSRSPWLQLARGVLTSVSSLLGLLSLEKLAVADFTAIIMLIPMVITVVSSTHLKEEVPVLGWLFLLAGLGGAMLVIRPGASGFQWEMLLSLGAVLFNAAFQLLTHHLSADDDPRAMHFYTGVVATFFFTVALPFFWESPSNWLIWGSMIFMGLCNTLGQYFMILAYSRQRPGRLMPYLYLQIAFATLFGWLAFGRIPDFWASLGILVIVTSGVVSALTRK